MLCGTHEKNVYEKIGVYRLYLCCKQTKTHVESGATPHDFRALYLLSSMNFQGTNKESFSKGYQPMVHKISSIF